MKRRLWIGIVFVALAVFTFAAYFLFAYYFVSPSEPVPQAPFTIFPETAYTGDIITFNASMIEVPSGSVAEYFWEFGDGTTATGATVSHAYVDNGAYIVELTVTADNILIGSTTAAKNVLNRPPVASLVKNFTSLKTGEPARLNASLSNDPDGTVMEYLWDFGDGNTATGKIVDHVYANGGMYTIMLKVIDDDGQAANASSTNLVLIAATGIVKQISMTAKNFEFNPSRIEVNGGDTVRLTITGLDDGIGNGHGLAIEGFGSSSIIRVNQSVVYEFVADKPGTFSFFCYQYCGPGHSQMTGTLVVNV